MGGAATMVSPCYALTARHVVFGDEQPMMEGRDYYHYNDFAVTLSIGNDGQGGPKWTIIADPVEFGAANEGGSDYALLHLRHCAGVDRTIGWMDWGKAEENLDVRMTGVQGDKVFGTMWNSHGQIVESFIDHTFDHNLPTRHGSSGNPLYTTRLGLPPLLRALNTGAKGDKASILPTYYAYLSNTAIDADYLYQIVGGRIQDNIDWFNRTFPGRQNPQRELSSSAAANVP